MLSSLKINDMLIYIILVILGYIVAKYLYPGNGFNVGANLGPIYCIPPSLGKNFGANLVQVPKCYDRASMEAAWNRTKYDSDVPDMPSDYIDGNNPFNRALRGYSSGFPECFKKCGETYDRPDKPNPGWWRWNDKLSQCNLISGPEPYTPNVGKSWDTENSCLAAHPLQDCEGSYGDCEQVNGSCIKTYHIDIPSANGGAACDAAAGDTSECLEGQCNTYKCNTTSGTCESGLWTPSESSTMSDCKLTNDICKAVNCSGSWVPANSSCVQAWNITTNARNGGNPCPFKKGATRPAPESGHDCQYYKCDDDGCSESDRVASYIESTCENECKSIDCHGSFGNCIVSKDEQGIAHCQKTYNITQDAGHGGEPCPYAAGAVVNCSDATELKKCSTEACDLYKEFGQCSMSQEGVHANVCIKERTSDTNKYFSNLCSPNYEECKQGDSTQNCVKTCEWKRECDVGSQCKATYSIDTNTENEWNTDEPSCKVGGCKLVGTKCSDEGKSCNDKSGQCSQCQWGPCKANHLGNCNKSPISTCWDIDRPIYTDDQIPCKPTDTCIAFDCTKNNQERMCVNSPGCTWSNNSCKKTVYGCTNNPCKNGGTCTDTINGEFTCSCTPDWTGDTCEKNHSCADKPCNNDGTCIVQPNGGFYCNCTEKWAGPTCDQEVENCLPEETCADGQACPLCKNPDADGKCLCPLPN